MADYRNKSWLELCELASKEQDPTKLMALLAEIDLLLAAEHDPKPSATISRIEKPNGRARLSRPHVKQ
jgi:hypothetical protein